VSEWLDECVGVRAVVLFVYLFVCDRCPRCIGKAATQSTSTIGYKFTFESTECASCVLATVGSNFPSGAKTVLTDTRNSVWRTRCVMQCGMDLHEWVRHDQVRDTRYKRYVRAVGW
jgi:hypothetical protein